jgi:hypothetical protein
MKLYTEEELLKAMAYARSYDANWVMTENEILKMLSPIELPSDEDMEQEAYYKVSDHTENPYASFKSGAKWMKEQILKQNK